ncbi:hypothetical protein [Streptomyces qinglanensis]|uniref:hypothetical protein n=1 Tax=Streptomyces qinglanensis TaxID=943816 RepID=UPI003D716945
MSDHPRDESPRTTPDDNDSTGRKESSSPRSAQQWRELLRKDQPPEQFTELPLFQRRRARRAWRSARRDARAQWIKSERRKVPTPLSVPIIALLLAGMVAAASWLWPDQGGETVQTKPHNTPSAVPSADGTTTPTSTSPPSHSANRPGTPDGVARAFVLSYCTRNPAQEADHRVAVSRAAPYASEGLLDNLKRHGDRDWNKLVAAQAMTATPTKVTVTAAPAKEDLPPDTAVRVYRQTTSRIQVKGIDDYHYTRHLTLEVSRTDIGRPWQVTRVLGVEE